jgi:hypothetical protein
MMEFTNAATKWETRPAAGGLLITSTRLTFNILLLRGEL